MTANKRLNRSTLVGLAAALLFSAGIVHLFRLRFERGDIYPAYSSLRSDPLGTRAFYESLAACPGTEVARNYEPITDLSIGPQTSLLFLGDTQDFDIYIPRHVVAGITKDIRRGARLVVTLKPRNWSVEEEEEEDSDDAETNAAPENCENQCEVEPEDAEESCPTCADDDAVDPGINFGDWVGLAIEDIPLEGAATAILNPEYGEASLPEEISCHSSVCFKDLTNGWKAVYYRDGRPVIVERPIRDGTLVMSALSFFVSNEALRYERYPQLLTWLVGGARRVVFDEYHHGLAKTKGLALLMRRYRLYWFVAALVLLALCFVWKNCVSLVPLSEEPSRVEAPVEIGRGSRSALVNILRRNITPSSILETGFSEWLRGADLKAPSAAERVKAAEQLLKNERLLSPAKRRPLVVYDRLCRILNPKLQDTGQVNKDNHRPS